jgi:hypothetical protein
MRISTYRILLLIAISLGFYTCTKSLDFPEENAVKEASALSFINAVPINRNLDVYLSGNKITDNNFSFGSRTDYGYMLPGSKTVEVSIQSATYRLKTETFNLSAKAYSLFVVNEIEKIELLLLEDDATVPPAGKAKVRFVNLSPDAGNLSLSLAGNVGEIAANKPFKAYSPFLVINPGEDVSFFVRRSGSNEYYVTTAKIEAGKTYTVFGKGFMKTSDPTSTFGIGVFEHK